MKIIDSLLNRITMYRLVVYALVGYTVLAIIYSLAGKFSYTATNMIMSLALIMIPAFVVDKGFGYLFRVPTNSESWLITSLIIFLIVQPAHTVEAAVALALAGAVSSASKFLITWNNRHIFNPAAIAAALVSLTALQPTTWWVGSNLLWPITLLFGLAVVRKIKRFPLFIAFTVASIGLQFGLFLIHHQPVLNGMKGALLASPLIFLTTIMLTEPATMPPRRNPQIVFGVLVAILYVTAWEIGPFSVYPEVALLIGNIYAFIVAPKLHLRLQLKEIQRISDSVYNYVFQPDRPFNFLPGQYMEWTLAGVPFDSRGNRRSFTIASSPTEDTVQVGLKYYQPASAYKATFAHMEIGDIIHASLLSGNFTVDMNFDKKLAFIAGGIGITPFRSIIKYFSDNNLDRDVILLYIVSNPADFAYSRDFLEARRIGLRIIPIVTQEDYQADGIVSGRLSQELIEQYVADYAERSFYISGPPLMVDASRQYLTNLGVSSLNIKTDHFSGY